MLQSLNYAATTAIVSPSDPLIDWFNARSLVHLPSLFCRRVYSKPACSRDLFSGGRSSGVAYAF